MMDIADMHYIILNSISYISASIYRIDMDNSIYLLMI